MAKRYVIINDAVFDTDHIFIGGIKKTKGQILEIDPETGEQHYKTRDGYGFTISDSRDNISLDVSSSVFDLEISAKTIRDGLVKELNGILSGKIEYDNRKLYV